MNTNKCPYDPYDPPNEVSYRYFVYGLVRQIEPNNILEIGLGPCTTAEKILQAIVENKKGHYYIIDGFLDFSQHLIQRFDKNLYTIIPSDSKNKNAYEILPELDIVCIDANHWEEYVYNDTQLSYLKLKNNGLFIWHDLNIPDTARAIKRCENDFDIKTFYFPEINIAIGRKA